jgi:hypothetical protein
VRLTLRTLLAYLDDELESPADIKQIGQKIAESDAARELIARIKQITRRRRLTAPPNSGPGAENFDPNTVAEYLESALPSDQTAEVEKRCLESDVHLAEIATCHQILTLALREPARVPPTARERMYGLVQGKESIPFRKASAAVASPAAPVVRRRGEDESDESPLSLELIRRGGWPRWVLPLAGILLVAGLILTLIKVIPGAPPGRQVAAASKKDNAQPAEPADQSVKADEKQEVVTAKPAAKEKDDTAEKAKAAEASAQPEKKTEPQAEPARTAGTPAKQPAETAPVQQTPPAAAGTEATGAPSTERRQLATYTVSPRSGPTLLVSRTGEQPWVRLTPGGRVWSADPLVSLPGFLSDVRLDSGVQLQLRGLLPQFTPPNEPIMKFLMESAVTLHASKDADLDFTLGRGRVYVSNHKDQGPARVRLRFDNEAWELTLAEPDTEVIVEVIRLNFGGVRWQEGEEPLTNVFLGFVKGRGSLKAEHQEHPDLRMPGPSLFSWNNKARRLKGPDPVQKPYAQWEKAPPPGKEADEMAAALADLSARMTDKRSVDVVLTEGLQSDRLPQRLLCIYSLGALDEIKRVLDVLDDEDANHESDRIAAVWTLRFWLSRGPQMGKLLYDPQTRSGLLTENRRFLTGEAETVVKLLYGFNESERRSADTYRVLADYLVSPKIAIRELAISNLYQLGAQVRYDPAWPEAEREKARAEINKRIDEHKLPPPLQGPTPAGGAAPAGR